MMAWVSSGSAFTPVLSVSCPRNLMLTTHFSLFSVRPDGSLMWLSTDNKR